MREGQSIQSVWIIYKNCCNALRSCSCNKGSSFAKNFFAAPDRSPFKRTTCPDDPNSLQKVCCNRLCPLCSLDNFVGSDRPLFAKRQLFGMICKSLPTSVFLFFRFYSFLLVPLKTCYQASHLSSSLKRGFSGLSLLPLMLSYSCERTNLSRGSISLFFRFVISH